MTQSPSDPSASKLSLTQAYGYLFRRHDWFKNLMMLTLCQMIPVVGPLAVIGFMLDVFHARRTDPDGPCPEFSFSRFGDYIGRGIWPFLAILVASVVIVPVMQIILVPAVLLIVALQPRGLVLALVIVLMILLYLCLLTAMMLLQTPILLRSLLMQDFGAGFNMAFTRDFLRRMWWRLLVKQILLTLTAPWIMIAGMICCYVGMFPAVSIVTTASWLMQFQIYEEYLRQGGMEIPVKLPPIPPVLAFEVGPVAAPPHL